MHQGRARAHQAASYETPPEGPLGRSVVAVDPQVIELEEHAIPLLKVARSNRAGVTRIKELQWFDSPVLFLFDRRDWNPGSGQVNARSYGRTVRVPEGRSMSTPVSTRARPSWPRSIESSKTSGTHLRASARDLIASEV